MPVWHLARDDKTRRHQRNSNHFVLPGDESGEVVSSHIFASEFQRSAQQVVNFSEKSPAILADGRNSDSCNMIIPQPS